MSGDGGHDRALLVEVRWPDGRFHGVREGREGGRRSEPVAPEWPPSPFRLFQALVAGAYGGRWAAEDPAEKDAAFEWLEALDPPSVAAPSRKKLQDVRYFVPNNDLDAVGGDPDRVGEIRSAKTLRTSLFDAERPAAYLWAFDGDAPQAERMAALVERLHTLGHGIDVAFARAEIVTAAEGEARLLALGGAPRRPARTGGGGGGGEPTPCPAPGSLKSLKTRHAAFTGRFARVGSGRKAATRFSQPPKAHARGVAYERAAVRRLYELRPVEGAKPFAAWPLTRAAALTVAVRDLLVANLGPSWPAEIERYVLGRGAGSGDKDMRLRILPLPSIGTVHTDMSVRRVLVEVPPDHPIPVADVDWALAGRELASADGELTGALLIPAEDRSMLTHYGASGRAGDDAARVWRTVTPAALPWRGVRGRADGGARAASESEAAGAVAQALRHAGVTTALASVRVQREPFDGRGERADAFKLEGDLAARFGARDLRHVEATFAEPVAGPLALGNGRWLGLGVMRPLPDKQVAEAAGMRGLHAFSVTSDAPLRAQDAEAATRALRRAVMARVDAGLERGRTLPGFFSGHAPRASHGTPHAGPTPPAASGRHEHLFFALDPGGAGRPPRLLVIPPHLADRSRRVRESRQDRDDDRRHLDMLDQALDGLEQVRAGALGVLDLTPTSRLETDGPDADPLLGRSTVWASLTDYDPCRHPRRGQDPDAAIAEDAAAEAARRGLPRPEVEVTARLDGPRGGVSARLTLRFASAVRGPVLLGQGSHFGRGLFRIA